MVMEWHIYEWEESVSGLVVDRQRMREMEREREIEMVNKVVVLEAKGHIRLSQSTHMSFILNVSVSN